MKFIQFIKSKPTVKMFIINISSKNPEQNVFWFPQWNDDFWSCETEDGGNCIFSFLKLGGCLPLISPSISEPDPDRHCFSVWCGLNWHFNDCGITILQYTTLFQRGIELCQSTIILMQILFRLSLDSCDLNGAEKIMRADSERIFSGAEKLAWNEAQHINFHRQSGCFEWHFLILLLLFYFLCSDSLWINTCGLTAMPKALNVSSLRHNTSQIISPLMKYNRSDDSNETKQICLCFSHLESAE